MIYLLDANVLIASSIAEHEHHDRVAVWLSSIDHFALCPIVEGALARFLLRIGETPAAAEELLARVHADQRCTFWPDDTSYRDVDLRDLQGHRQVTDAYLATLAHANGGRLATLDERLASIRPHGTLLIP
ncbi:MAG: TA system VapC family ribonuclease toxin [Ornithinimicrobium sp.]